MKRNFLLTLMVCGVLAGARWDACRADASAETGLIKTLQATNASPKEKAEACAQLKRIGTRESIPALAALLTDEKLSLSARYALESMSAPEAGQALLQALPRASGLMQAGIIQSLGARGNKRAVPEVGKLLSVTDTNVAVAAAEALGRMGGPIALDFLQKSAGASTGSVHEAEVDGILMCAQQWLDTGKQPDALKVYEKLYTTEKSGVVRLAAFRGIILASGKQGTARLADAIVNGDGASQSAALRTASQLEGSEVTKALAESLSKVGVPVQLALIQCLAQRGDSMALSELMQQVDSADADVAVAATAALGKLGDDSVIPLLAETAASGGGAKRAAARESLLELVNGPVTQRMLELLQTVSAPAKIELVQALGGRGDAAAAPALMDLAEHGDEAAVAPVLQTLGQLGNGAQIPRLVQLVAQANTDDFRSGAADALNSILQRAQAPGVKLDVSALLAAARSGSIETRVTLLPICGEVSQAPAREALRAAAADTDMRIREAGIRALCDTRDAELLPDLLKLAVNTNQSAMRLLAIRGCVRLTTQEEGAHFSNDAKLDALTAMLDSPLSTQEKQAVLSGLGDVADERALAPAMRMLDDGAVRAEAELALVRIATNLSPTQPDKARAALKKVMAVSTNPAVKKSAQVALNKIKLFR